MLLLLPTLVFAHGNHGNGGISIEDMFASPWHLHLPVEIGLDGSVHYGYNFPWSDGHDHGDHDDDGHDDGHHDGGHDDGHHDGEDDDDGHHDGDEDGDHDDEEHEEGHGSNWTIHPSIIFAGDKISRVLALDELLIAGRSGNVEPTNNSKGFLVINNTKITGGLGIDLDYHLPINGGLVGIGISKVKGSKKYTEQYVSSLEEKKNLKSLKAPKTLKDLNSWTIGDRLVFGVTGGFTLMAHFGIEPLVHAGPLYHVGGSWMIKLKKLDEKKMELRIVKNDIKAFAIEADGVLISAELEKFNGQDKFMSFIFDLSNPNAEIALAKLYKGDIKYAQKLMLQENTGVERQTKGSSLSSGSTKLVKFSLPFLFGASKAKSKLSSYGNEDDLIRDSKTKVYSSVVSVEKTTKGILSNHKMAVKNFYANFADEWHVDHQHVSFGGTFKWMYEKDRVYANTVKNKLKKLQKITGMYKALDLKLPEKELGYFRVEFDTNISDKDTLRLMGLPEGKVDTTKTLFNIAKVNSNDLITEHFDKRGTRGLCANELSRSECLADVKSKTQKALIVLEQKADQMRKLFKEKEYKEWTQAYAVWGSQLISNQFVFKSVLKQLKTTKFTVSIKGEKVATQKLKLRLK
jgi:hypothetical protein